MRRLGVRNRSSFQPGPPENKERPISPLTPEEEAGLARIKDLIALPLESFATLRPIRSADALLSLLHSYPLSDRRWAFRGQEDAGWPLQSSIERLADKYRGSFMPSAERYIRTRFRQRAHHYLQYLPGDNEELEWLALMRHYGAPTRLLDWTWSPYVAAFFALADAKQDRESAICAVNTATVKAEAIQMLVEDGVIQAAEGSPFSFSDPGIFDRVFLGDIGESVVAPVQPGKMNERVTSQQGLFLCYTGNFGFEFALKRVLKIDRDRGAAVAELHWKERLFKLCIPPQARAEILRELHRMNISYATLFPGLDGFAQCLGTNAMIARISYVESDYFESSV